MAVNSTRCVALYALIAFATSITVAEVHPAMRWIAFGSLLVWLLWLTWLFSHPPIKSGDGRIAVIISDCASCWRHPAFPLVAYIVAVDVFWLYDWFYVRQQGISINVDSFNWHSPSLDTQATLKDLSARMLVQAVDILELAAGLVAWFLMLRVCITEWTCRKLWGLIVFAAVAGIVYWFLQWGHLPSKGGDPWQGMVVMNTFNNKVKQLTGFEDFAAYFRIWSSHLSLAGLAFACFVVGLIMSEPAKDRAGIKSQIEKITLIMYATAIAMILHVVELGIYRLRAAALLDEPNAALVRKLGTIIAINAGIQGVFFLAAFTLPAVQMLIEIARHLPVGVSVGFGRNTTESREERIDSSKQFYLRLATTLSPLIGGIPLLKLLIELVH